MSEDGESVLNVDCHNIYAFDQTLYGHLVNYPAEVTSLLDAETRNLLIQLTDRSPDEFEDVMVCHFGFHHQRYFASPSKPQILRSELYCSPRTLQSSCCESAARTIYKLPST